MGKYLFLFSSVFVFSLFVMWVLRKFAFKTKVLVSKNIALIGGIGIAIGLAFSSGLGFLVFGLDPRQIVPVIGISLVMLLFGVMDDLREASVLQKILLQCIGAVLLISIDIRTHIVYLDYWSNCVITFFWILGITNALNLLDTMDGLSSGVAFIATIALFVLSLFYPDINIQILALGLSAAILGFLVFNIPPATIYLGNAGSHFLGFLLAALTLMVSYTVLDSSVALVCPIIILWVPLLETVCLIYFRLRKSIIPFNKSNDHIAFRLMALGCTRHGVLLIMLGLALFCALCGIMIGRMNNIIGAVIVMAVVIVSFFFFKVLTKAECHG